MASKGRYEGYLLVDNSVGGKSRIERATITCSHCQRVVVLNPDRSRQRHYCPKCDHYICDGCEVARAVRGGACVTFNQIIEEAQERALKGSANG